MTPRELSRSRPPTPSRSGPAAIPGYEILSELGRGGMGVVYKARDTKLNRTVALKMVLSGSHADPKELVRFLAEAEAVAAIEHPHVVRVFGYGEHDGRPFMALEFCGGSLAGYLRQSPGRERGCGVSLAPAGAAAVVEKVARGVQAAHDLGIVHRDLKPGNVLLSASREPKVTDFGLAKRGGGSGLTQTNAVMGTPAYMAPEQARGQTKFVGPAADVYALGVILYECLAGRPPFDGDDTVAILMMQVEEDPPLSRFVSGVPRDLELICRKCLAKEPHERYPTAAALADDLGRFQRGEAVSVRPAGRRERVAKWARRKPTLAAAYGLTAVSLVLIGLVAGAVWLWQRAEHNRQDAEGQRDETDKARQGEALARQEVEREREKLAAIEYGRTIQAAYGAWQDNNVSAAVALLEGTKPKYRGWEWRYVRRLCNGQLLSLDHAGMVYSAAHSPDGSLVVTGAEDQNARVWNAASGTLLYVLPHNSKVENAAYSPSG